MTAASSDLLTTNKQACLDCSAVCDSTFSNCWTWLDDAYKSCLMLSCYKCMSKFDALLHHAQCTKVIKKQCTSRCLCLITTIDD